MKSFLKFIVTLLVLAIIGYIAHYLIINSNNDNNTILSGDIMHEENEEEISGGNVDEEIIFPVKSGEISEEINSGEITGIDSKEDIMRRIDKQVEIINSGEILSTISENLTADLLCDSAREFMDYFKVEELAATVNIKESCVEIIPTSDFLENMVYYYDENGSLILYESVSNTVGGNTKYYFEKGSSIDVVWDYEEDVEKQEEYVFAVLGRAQVIYDKYLKK